MAASSCVQFITSQFITSRFIIKREKQSAVGVVLAAFIRHSHTTVADLFNLCIYAMEDNSDMQHVNTVQYNTIQ